MFTGLVEEVGVVESVIKSPKSAVIKIKANKVLEGVKIGDSISTNGVCLTVTNFDSNSFTVDVMAETMRRSNLKELMRGSRVNLERALKVGDRIGGHLVSGHIDGVGVIKNFEEEDIAVWISIAAHQDILKYVVYKGSIAIDGVSLTVAYVDCDIFKVSIIPHTKAVTTLIEKNIGDEVNIECDMIGKYVERFLFFKDPSTAKKDIDIDFLSEHGFI